MTNFPGLLYYLAGSRKFWPRENRSQVGLDLVGLGQKRRRGKCAALKGVEDNYFRGGKSGRVKIKGRGGGKCAALKRVGE